MLLTITTTHNPATDLGYLLHKNPAKAQTFDLNFGKAHVFYPLVTPEKCTAALLLEIDPVGLVRGGKNNSAEGGPLDQYVNDRPYVASSFMSVALKEVFGSALNGKCRDRPALAELAIPLEAQLSVVASRGGEKILRDLFEPLGYTLKLDGYPLDETQPDWGASPYFSLTLSATCRLSELLSHLYVLLPVLDNTKHYWISEDEIEKLLRHGEGWLAKHPAKEFIARRYLRFRGLVRTALSRLVEVEEAVDDPDEAELSHTAEEIALERPISLNESRLTTVLTRVKESGAKRVLDLGCGEGKLLQRLINEKQFEHVTGLDVAHRTLQMARDRLKVERMPERQRERLSLLHGSLIYQDDRLKDYDAACVVEVIEHLDLPRLTAFERVLFEFAKPQTVIVTTPNAEYNVKFEGLPAGKFRHKDHRFEWSRAEFEAWAQNIAGRYGYTVRFEPIGTVDDVVGAPTQMGVFTR
jgi:3' terminal RNA ribose 2'-O-methyltransferase Hen1